MSKAKRFHLTYDNILVKWVDPETKTKGGIFIPNASSQQRPLQGTVVALGPHVSQTMNMGQELKVGDEVLFEQFAGSPVKLGDREFLLMSAEDIILVFEES